MRITISRTAYRIIITGICILVCILSYWFGIFNFWQEQLTDRLFIKQPQPQNIIIIAADSTSLKTIGQWPWPREVFAKAIDRLQNTKAIAFDINFSEPSRIGTKDDELFAAALNRSKVPVILPVELRTQGGVMTRPLPTFEKISTQGFVNVASDADGVLRKTDTTSKENIPSLSMALTGSNNPPATIRINYRGPASTYLTLPIIDVINGVVPESILKDSYVLIGATAESLRDNFKTPFGLMPGVEIHANSANTLLEQKYLMDTSPLVSIILILLVSVIAVYCVIYIKNFLFLAICLLVSLIILHVVALGIFSFGIIVPLLYLDLAFILNLGAILGLEYISESKDKRFIRKSFQYYLSPEVVEEITKHPEKLRLGGERKKLTILFSDIRGFTTISESMSAETLTQLINEYLTAMTDIIMDHKGLVDKYIGDAIMAFWGAPVDAEQQVKNAGDSVLLMSKKLEELNVGWKARGIPHLAIGIGLNTGEVVVGNMGSSKRFNYTAMGDDVNFASRLEGLNKMYGTMCIVSESTAKELQSLNTFTLRELDLVMVKGKKEPKLIFELITQPLDESLKKLLADFAAARALYTKGLWDEAVRAFEEILKYKDDGPSKAFIERCYELKATPQVNWTGAYEFHSK